MDELRNKFIEKSNLPKSFLVFDNECGEFESSEAEIAWQGFLIGLQVAKEQSPAVVAVQKDESLFFDSNSEEKFDECYDVDELKKCIFNLYEDIRCLKEDTKSPRITEQEFREIFIHLGFPEMMFGDWMKNRGGRALLEKLNKV